MDKPGCFGQEIRIYGLKYYLCNHHPDCLFQDDCYLKLIENLHLSTQKVNNK